MTNKSGRPRVHPPVGTVVWQGNLETREQQLVRENRQLRKEITQLRYRIRLFTALLFGAGRDSDDGHSVRREHPRDRMPV